MTMTYSAISAIATAFIKADPSTLTQELEGEEIYQEIHEIGEKRGAGAGEYEGGDIKPTI